MLPINQDDKRFQSLNYLAERSAKIWKNRCNEKYWKDYRNLNYRYYYLTHERHMPTHTILHSTNTCFIAGACNLLQIALSYVENKTCEELQFYKLMKRALIRGDEDEQLIFLNNMQCFVFNPILALNRRNKYLILNNIPLVTCFDPRYSLNDLINYNIDAIYEVYQINLKDKINDIFNMCKYWPLYLLLVKYKDREYNRIIKSILMDPDEFYDWTEWLNKYKLDIKTAPKDVIYRFTNELHSAIIETDKLFAETIYKLDWQECPYLYCLTTFIKPIEIETSLIRFELTSDINTLNCLDVLNIRFTSKIDEKVIDIPTFVDLLTKDNRINIEYAFKKYSSSFNIKNPYHILNYNGSFSFPHINNFYNTTTNNSNRTPTFVKYSEKDKMIDFKEVASIYDSGWHWNIKVEKSFIIDDMEKLQTNNIHNSTIKIPTFTITDNKDYTFVKNIETDFKTVDNFVLMIPDEILERKHIRISGGKELIFSITLAFFLLIVIIIEIIILIKNRHTNNSLHSRYYV